MTESSFRMKKSAGLAFVFVAFASNAFAAQDIKALGQFEHWTAWANQNSGSSACYVYSDARTKSPANLNHGAVGFSIRHMNEGGVKSEASFRSGYELSSEPIQVTVDGAAFTMIAKGQYAWLQRVEREDEFLRALTGGREMSVQAASKRGNRTNYTFSLAGVTKAMQAARQGCR